MAKLVLSDIASGYASAAALDANFTAIETALENTLSRDGTTPNHLLADVDMNGHNLLNIGTLDITSLSADTLTINGDIVVPTALAVSALPDQTGHANEYLTTDGTNASWGEINTHGVNVKDSPYNAVGDGVADDTAAIQAAIAAGGQNATIIYPKGTYLITSAITLLPQQHHLSFGAIFSVATGISAFTITADGWPGRVKFSDARFQGTGLSGRAISIINNTPFVEVDNCYFTGFDKAVYLAGSYCSNIKNSYFTGNNHGVHLTNETHSSSLTNCFFDANTYTGLAINGDSVTGNIGTTPIHNITTLGCAFQNSQYGVWAEACYELHMLNTYNEGNTVNDLKLGVADAGAYLRYCYNFTIDGWQSSSACASGTNIALAHAVAGNLEGLAFNGGTSTTAAVLTVDGFSDRIYIDYHCVQTATPSLTVPFTFTGAAADRVTVAYNGATTFPRGLEAIKFGTQAAIPEKIYSGYEPSASRPALVLESLGTNQDMVIQVTDVERHLDAADYIGFSVDHLSNAVNFGYTCRPTIDNTYYFGTPTERFSHAYAVEFHAGAGNVLWTSGAGTPEGAVTAPIGSLFTRTDGGVSTTLYVKTSGAGNTGWTAK